MNDIEAGNTCSALVGTAIEAVVGIHDFLPGVVFPYTNAGSVVRNQCRYCLRFSERAL